MYVHRISVLFLIDHTRCVLFTALYRIYFIGIANCYVNVVENVTANETKQNRTVYDRE